MHNYGFAQYLGQALLVAIGGIDTSLLQCSSGIASLYPSLLRLKTVSVDDEITSPEDQKDMIDYDARDISRKDTGRFRNYDYDSATHSSHRISPTSTVPLIPPEDIDPLLQMSKGKKGKTVLRKDDNKFLLCASRRGILAIPVQSL